MIKNKIGSYDWQKYQTSKLYIETSIADLSKQSMSQEFVMIMKTICFGKELIIYNVSHYKTITTVTLTLQILAISKYTKIVRYNTIFSHPSYLRYIC